jgi:hypothetical protein
MARRSQWDAIQEKFVDEPRHVVGQADSLVALAMKRLAGMFAAERARLEGQWDRGDNVSTEDPSRIESTIRSDDDGYPEVISPN